MSKSREGQAIRALALLALALLVGGCARRGPSLPAGSRTLRLTMTKGQTLRYQSTTSSQDHGRPFQQVMTTRFDVLATEPNYDLTMTIEKVDVHAEKPAIEAPLKGIQFDAVYGPRGRLKKLRPLVPSPVGEAMAAGLIAGSIGFMGVEYPEAPVRVGSKWAGPVDLSRTIRALAPGIETKDATVPLEFTFVGVTDAGDKLLANIDYRMKGSARFQAGSREVVLSVDTRGKLTVDLHSGLPETNEATATNTVTAGGKSTVQRVTISSRRLG